MKTKITLFLILLALFASNNELKAQSVFKDLTPGTVSSNPEQFMNVNGTMYFVTVSNYVHALWKSDGTVANTVKVKDSIIITNVGTAVCLRANVNGTLYYSVNSLGISAGTTTYLWKTNGSAPVLIDTLPHASGKYPVGFTVVGNNVFFSMGKNNGRELWVTDGTEAGTTEVIDLLPGANDGLAGINMVAYNGKVYFQGSSTLGGQELYSSDGTPGGTTLVVPGTVLSDPKFWIVYKNELYFGANGGGMLWKTDGTAVGTVNIASTGFNDNTKIFNNEMFYSVNGTLWKSDGTTGGTVPVKDSAGGMVGANSNYFFTSYMKSLTVAPWFKIYYWRSDGTAGGTVRVSDSVGLSASFNVLNNKMYNTVSGSGVVASGLWETDGTTAGTTMHLASSAMPYPPFVFNTDVFFSNWMSGGGYELWWLSPSGVGITEPMSNNTGLLVYPNPSNGKFQISVSPSGTEPVQLKITDILGKEVHIENIPAGSNTDVLDLNYLPNGIYMLRCNNNVYSQKLIIQK